ncbi:hypothetical protein DRP07_08925 [Archaeoglobales archaeon]|nr:MAG: hypothetical protein DRP07_08925 [Archaeoglobales archaeon]
MESFKFKDTFSNSDFFGFELLYETLFYFTNPSKILFIFRKFKMKIFKNHLRTLTHDFIIQEDLKVI